MQRAILLITTCVLFLAVAATPTSAEVTVQTNRNGEYVATSVVPGGPSWNPGVWGARARTSLRRGSSLLNADGDRIGDLNPTIVENNFAPHHPWAVWSRFNGSDYDLVWSSWNRVWTPIEAVSTVSLEGDDLDPSIAFHKRGWPLLAWWVRDADTGAGTVYFSMYLSTRWLEPVRVSGAEFGGRNPNIYINRNGQIEITYASDDGTAQLTQQVLLDSPGTITDDIDPQTMVFVTVGTVTVKRAP